MLVVISVNGYSLMFSGASDIAIAENTACQTSFSHHLPAEMRIIPDKMQQRSQTPLLLRARSDRHLLSTSSLFRKKLHIFYILSNRIVFKLCSQDWKIKKCRNLSKISLKNCIVIPWLFSLKRKLRGTLSKNSLQSVT